MSAPKVSAPVLDWIGIREFARRDGCNEKLVRNAKRDGHLGDPAAKLLDAALVGTGWRKSNRRGADKPSADTEKVRTSSEQAQTLPDVACSLVAMCDAFAVEASFVLLRHLPLATVRTIIAELLASSRRGATEMLFEDDVDPPSGYASWSTHPWFTRQVPSKADWAEAVQEAKARVPV